MRFRHWGCVSFLAALFAVASASLSARGQQVQFRTSVEALQFQVAVADEAGAFVPGLTAADFLVRVNGAARDVISAYEVDLGTPADAESESEPEPLDVDALPAAGWRQFVLFFDAAFNSTRGVRAAQQAALQFLDEQALPTDLVGVVTFNVVEGVKVRVPLTRDRQQVRDAIGGLGLTQATRVVDRPGFLVGTILGDATSRDSEAAGGATDLDQALQDILGQIARAEYSQYQNWVSAYVNQIGQLGEILEVIRGRKQVLFFTTGFDDRILTGKTLDELAADRARIEFGSGEGLASVNPEETYGSADVRSTMQKALEELRSADTVMHMIDVSGVGGGQDANMFRGARPGGVSSGRSSLTVWADGTGGSVVWNTNDVGSAIADIERSSRQYYVLAISRRPDDPEELDLQVEVTRPGVRVTAAPTRFAPPPAYEDMSEAQRQAQLAELVTKGSDETALSFDLMAVPFPGKGRIARLPVVLEVPWAQLEQIGQARGDDRVALDVLGYVMTDAGVMIDLTDRHVELDLGRMRDRMQGLPLRVYDLLWAWAGAQRVRVVVRESELGLASASSVDVQVPELEGDKLAVAPPVLLDAAHPGMVMRTFDPEAPPPHKKDGPVAYPFVAGGQELTPMARAELEAGQAWQLLVTAFHLTRHPFTGQTQPAVQVALVDGAGQRTPLPSLTTLGQQADQETRATSLWLGIQDTNAVAPGFYRLEVTVIDAIAGTEARGETDTWVR